MPAIREIVTAYESKTGDEKKAALEELNKVNGSVSKTAVKDNQADPKPLVDNVPYDAGESDKLEAEPTEQKYTETDGNNRNTNSTILVYGQRSHTEWKKAEVTTYQFEVAKTAYNKTGTDGMQEHLLAGAQFSLYKATEFTKDNSNTIPTPGSGVISFVPASCKDTLTGMTPGQKGYYTTSDALVFDKEDGTTTTTDPGTGAETTEIVPHSKYHYKGDVKTADGNENDTRVLESLGGEVINVHGLEEGWYMLVEGTAPTGYNKLAHPIMVYVTGDKDSDGTRPTDGADKYNSKTDEKATEDYDADEGMLNAYGMNNNSLAQSTSSLSNTINSVDDAKIPWAVTLTKDPSDETNPTKYESGGVHVLNQTGAELPSTGGIGTTLFYVAGTVLVVGAAVMLVTKRRMGAEA